MDRILSYYPVFEIAKNFEDGLRTNNISRPAKQPGLYTSIRSIQFLISIPGGSRQHRCMRTNLGIETRRIGTDGGACARSVGGIVHAYMTTSGGHVSRQMARDLSVNGQGGRGITFNLPQRTRNFEKLSFLKWGTFDKSAALSLLKRSALGESSALPALVGGAGSTPFSICGRGAPWSQNGRYRETCQ